MHAVSVCSFTLGLDLAECGITMCYFTGLEIAERGVIMSSFTFPDLLEWGINECSLLRLSVLANIGVHEFSFY